MPETRNESAKFADRLLQDMRDAQRRVSVYLVNGFQLKGEIVEFDEEAVLFKLNDFHQLVMRAAVGTMYPVADSTQDTNGWWSSYSSESV